MRWKDLFEPHILKRGRTYYEDECVTSLEIKDDNICAEVEGSDFYQVYITFQGDEVLDMECDCPHALKGYNCKHMAAVFFAYEEQMSEYEEEESIASEAGSEVSVNRKDELKALVDKIPEEDVRKILAGILASDESLKNRLKLTYDFQINALQMADMKKEIRSIVYKYAGRGGYIDWENAFSFCCDMNRFLDEKIPLLMEHECYLQAFEIVNLVFWEVGNTDMDDSDGESGFVTDTCYDYWEKIVCSCNENDRAVIEEWFRDHKETDYVIDYMKEYLDDFFEQHFLSDEDIRERMSLLDEIIEEHKDQNDCGKIYTVRHGYQYAALQRIGCMRRLGISEEDILEYRALHRHFFCIRELEIAEALEKGDRDLAIQILEESKVMDTEYSGRVKQYSQNLIALYRESGYKEKYKDELIFQVTQCEQANLSYFNELKAIISSEEEWEELTELVLSKSSSIYFKCEVLYQEEKYEELMQIIENGNRVSMLDEYEKKLRNVFPERVMKVYIDYVIPEMNRASTRKHYWNLVQYLKKIAKCEKEKTEAIKVAQLWKTQYRRRSALMDELRKAGF